MLAINHTSFIVAPRALVTDVQEHKRQTIVHVKTCDVKVSGKRLQFDFSD